MPWCDQDVTVSVETFIGGPEEGLKGRQKGQKALVVIGAQEDGRGIGSIRMRRIPNASGASLHGFIRDAIERGSVVRTDGWRGYWGVNGLGYRHEVVKLKGGDAMELLPRVHQVVTLLKRWLSGTHQGAVSAERLDYYLDEFTSFVSTDGRHGIGASCSIACSSRPWRSTPLHTEHLVSEPQGRGRRPHH